MHARCAFVLVAAFGIASCGDDASSSAGEAGTSDASSGRPATTTSQADTSGSSGDPTTPTEPGTSSGDGDSSSGGGFVPIDCTESCADQQSDAGIAVCYSCRCKNAMDGWLPSVEQLQCSEAEVLPLYGVDTSGPQPQLVDSATDLDTCANPALLYETCHAGSKLGQLQEGDISVKWVCRSPMDGIYSDMGAIMYNARTGASCWFDDIDAVTTDDNVPDLDLMEAGEDNLAAYLGRFYFTDGNSCTGDCHDADPFIYTPVIESPEQWMDMYGAAKSKIGECCANPGVDSPDCDWEPIPAP